MRYLLYSFCVAITFIACNPSKSYELTEREKHLCDSLKIDQEIIKELREVSASNVEAFHYSLSRMYSEGKEIELDPVYLEGLVFDEKHSESYETVFALKDKFRAKGYSIFLLDNNFDIGGKADRLAILKTTDKYEILSNIRTNGANYNIDPDSLITIIKDFDKKYSLELIGASGDWCEFIVHNEKTDWRQLAKEAYAVCPDIVDQGTGTILALERELRMTKRLYFWWD
ncbi:MAG: DUF4253 domain-containing protein [Dysgonomonas sp.]|nr:DUF4253 domain-containing protein [Dysgonomonas sp.]